MLKYLDIIFSIVSFILAVALGMLSNWLQLQPRGTFANQNFSLVLLLAIVFGLISFILLCVFANTTH